MFSVARNCRTETAVGVSALSWCINQCRFRHRSGSFRRISPSEVANISVLMLVNLTAWENEFLKNNALTAIYIYIYIYISIRRVQVNQDGLKLNGTHHLLAYADDVNILRGSVHTVQKNAEALVVVTEEIGLEVNADKTKHMIMSRDQNAG